MASRSGVKPKRAKVTWFELLSQKRCTNCSTGLKPLEDGLYRAFCPTCTAKLPAVVSLHLDRALCNSWFVRRWRFACQILRNQPIKLPASVIEIKKRRAS
jgi:hypothetical protein